MQADGTGTAKVNFYDPNMRMLVLDDGCIITMDGEYMAEPGAIWASLNCDHIGSTEDSRLWCAASGVFVFKNCEK